MASAQTSILGGRQPRYILGHDRDELDRLIDQARFFGDLTDEVLRRAGVGPGMRVLDLGCGTGDVLFLATRLVGPTGAVLGVDRSAAAVAVAERRARDAGLGNVSFVVQELSEVTVTARSTPWWARLRLPGPDRPEAGPDLPRGRAARPPDLQGARVESRAWAPRRSGRTPRPACVSSAPTASSWTTPTSTTAPPRRRRPWRPGRAGRGRHGRAAGASNHATWRIERARAIAQAQAPPATYDHPTNHARGARLAVLGEAATELGATPNQVVPAWLMGGQRPIIPVVGTSTVAQLDELLGVVELPWTTTSAGTWTWPAVTPTTNRPSSAGCAPPSGRPSGTRPARSTSYDLHALHTSAYCRGHGPRPGTGCSRSHAQCTQGAGRRAWPYPDRLPTRRVGEARRSSHQRRDRRAIGPS